MEREKQIRVPECGRHTRQNATESGNFQPLGDPFMTPESSINLPRARYEVGFPLSALSHPLPGYILYRPALQSSVRVCTVPEGRDNVGGVTRGTLGARPDRSGGSPSNVTCVWRQPTGHLHESAHGMCWLCRGGTGLEDLLRLAFPLPLSPVSLHTRQTKDEATPAGKADPKVCRSPSPRESVPVRRQDSHLTTWDAGRRQGRKEGKGARLVTPTCPTTP